MIRELRQIRREWKMREQIVGRRIWPSPAQWPLVALLTACALADEVRRWRREADPK